MKEIAIFAMRAQKFQTLCSVIEHLQHITKLFDD